MSPESRLPARSVLLLRRGVHWTPAPSKAAGAIYPFSGSKNVEDGSRIMKKRSRTRALL